METFERMKRVRERTLKEVKVAVETEALPEMEVKWNFKSYLTLGWKSVLLFPLWYTCNHSDVTGCCHTPQYTTGTSQQQDRWEVERLDVREKSEGGRGGAV